MRDRLTAFIATPAPAGSTAGNRVTALRWAKRLRELGWTARIETAWTGEPCDLLVALHARKSHGSLVAHARARPQTPRVLALTGTDLYEGEPDEIIRESLELATRLVVLQPLALDRLPAPLRARACVIRQSAIAVRSPPAQPGLTACVLAHLREVKDPLLAARAASLVDAAVPLRIVHVGAAPDEVWARRARAAERAADGRWQWLGAMRRSDALRLLGSSHLAVLTSRSEGGANVVTEAIAAGVPVLSTRIDGSLGILGEAYPGYFAVGDAAGLAALLSRCVSQASFLDDLRARVTALGPLVDPGQERASWRELIHALGVEA